MIVGVDPRREQALADEMRRRAEAVLGTAASTGETGPVEDAIITVAARISEEVTQRLDKVPDKQTDNFYSAVGIGRAPARPARVPVAFKLSDTAPAGLVAPAATKLSASTGDSTTIFETGSGLDLARGSISKLVAVDLENDRIFVSPPGVPQAQLPPPAAIQRQIVGGAAAGATVVQITPATGLAPGMAISVETADGPAEYGITAVEGDLITIEPPLAANVAETGKVAEISVFAPFEKAARDRQSHTLYLSHPTLLDLPSEAMVVVSGLTLEQIPEWAWFGKIDQDAPKPEWQSFEKVEQTATGWKLSKPKGKPEQTPIDGRSALWIRARLPGPSKQTEFGKTIRLSIGDPADCKSGQGSCDDADSGVDYEAIAVTTPVVTNKPYYPFGREPRLFDSFYIGCKEAFGKDGARVSLCFEFGGPKLGPLAAVSDGFSAEVYGVGTDGQLWRAMIAADKSASFSPLPGLPESGGGSFAKQAFVAAQLNGRKVRVAIADDKAVYVGDFDYGAPSAKIVWTRLTADSAAPPAEVTAIFLSSDANRTVHAIAGSELFEWKDEQSPATVLPDEAVDLLPVLGAGGPDRALVITMVPTGAYAGRWNVQLKRADSSALEAVEIVDPAEFPDGFRAAWARAGEDVFYVAGFDANGQLIVTKVDSSADKIVAGSADAQPVAFAELSNVKPEWPPAMVLATARPTLFVPTGEDSKPYDKVTDPSEIGVSDNPYRRLLTVNGWTVVQHADQGLLYRSSQGQQPVAEISFHGRADVVIPSDDIPTGADWLRFDGQPNGDGFYLAANAAGDRLLAPLSTSAVVGDPADVLFFKVSDPQQRDVQISAGQVTIDHVQPQNDVSILLTATSGSTTEFSIWQLSQTQNGWAEPGGFPTGSTLTCVLLEKASTGQEPQFRQYFWLEDQSLSTALSSGPLRSLNDNSVVIDRVENFSGLPAIALPHDLIENEANLARFALTPDPWKSIGPDKPANPALSWEYWNGSAWWGLDQSNFIDETADLQVGGGLYFTVPGDLEETEVGGQKDRWIRARLVGGDYGEARVTVTTSKTSDPDKSEQTVTRDLSAIRAPYVTRLSIIYCAVVPASPQFVLGADNLGVIDRTGANDADVPVPVFPPVWTLFRPLVPDADRRIDEACCERWFEPEPRAAPEGERSIDEQSCERWFEQPGSGGNAQHEDRPTRALMIGFDEQPRPGRLSLYFDVLARYARRDLEAQFFRGGTFDDVIVADESSSGLAERGIVPIQIENPPDLLQLFGTAAYWLRLTAKGDDSEWSPEVRGIYLNGSVASSVESRSLETVGTSSGAPDQKFYLAARPLDPDSLVLQVQEPIGAEQAAALNAVEEISGMPGPWVRWTYVASLDDDRPGPRRFELDAETGTLTFGDGKDRGAVPPIGSQILAYFYQAVVGSAANNVNAGDKIDMVTPIAGVEQVIALDAAQGGIDIEPAEEARSRAPAKIRNQNSIVSLADLEDFVRTRVQSAAQVRASNWRGGVRVIVVSRGIDPVPPPSALAAVREAIGNASTYRLRAPGVLTVLGPRPLPLDIQITLEPDPRQDFVTLEQSAKDKIAKLLDHETGGHHGGGWPVGVLPTKADIAAVLEPLTEKAVVRVESIRRTDSKPLPLEFPSDVLARLGDVAVELARQAAA